MAESILRAHLNSYGDDFAYIEELGLVLVQQGRREDAIKEYRKALKEFPQHEGRAGMYCNLGLALEFSKHYDEALKAYLKSVELKPKMVQTHIDLGNFYRFVKHDYTKARAQLQQAIALNPKDSIAHGGLAAIYADQGELKRAEKAFRDALELTPNAVVMKTELAYVLERQGRLDEAQKLFEAAIRDAPQFYRAHEGLARVYQKRHEMNAAEMQAKTAVGLKSDAATLEVLASVYQEEGKTAHAHKFWRAVLKANPSDAAAKRYLGLAPKGQSASSSGEGTAVTHGGSVWIGCLVAATVIAVLTILWYVREDTSSSCDTPTRNLQASSWGSGSRSNRKDEDQEQGVGLLDYSEPMTDDFV